MSPQSSVASTPDHETNIHDEFDHDIPSNPTSVADRLRQVEIELAEKKLALTQALCENQELIHQIRHSASVTSDSDTNSVNSLRAVNHNNNNNNNSTVSWLSKTVNTIKEAAANSANRAKVN